MRHARKDYDRFQDPAVDRPELLGRGCTAIAPSEPVFLIRGTDRVAVRTLLYWADEAEAEGALEELVEAVRAWAEEIEKWQAAHLTLVHTPDAPIEVLR